MATNDAPKPQPRESFRVVHEAYDEAFHRLTAEEYKFVEEIAKKGNLKETEQFLTDNFSRLSESQKHFLLQALRVKKFNQ